jgi:hypothetical protein
MSTLIAETTHLPDLTPVAPEAAWAEGDPRPIYTCQVTTAHRISTVESYAPSDGSAPRLMANLGMGQDRCVGVWDTGTGAFVRALHGPHSGQEFWSLTTYQRPSDGRPRVAAGSARGHLCVWDGDDFSALHTIETNPEGRSLAKMVVYEDPATGRTRLVTS